jgi:hypothetical protein
VSQSTQIRRFGLAVAASALMVAGCSDQANNSANSSAKQPVPASAKKAPASKPAAKPATSPQVAAKPAAKQGQASPAVAKQSAPAKQVNASSKTPVAAKPAKAVNSTPATLVAIPKGTVLSAKLGEGLGSSKNRAGDTFAAVLTSSVKVDGKTVIPKGTHVTGRVVTVKKKNPELTVALTSMDLNGKSYKLATEPIAPGKSTTKDDAAQSDPATAPKEITVPAEHRLRFKLAKTVKLPATAKS